MVDQGVDLLPGLLRRELGEEGFGEVLGVQGPVLVGKEELEELVRPPPSEVPRTEFPPPVADPEAPQGIDLQLGDGPGLLFWKEQGKDQPLQPEGRPIPELGLPV
ncbi:hypothetical protein, partial [Thermus scotoductus]|uniref:hypothetical protein n=1 Tax=Thermus scotoductus TaxID=37636 RepID=UPI0020A26DDA